MRKLTLIAAVTAITLAVPVAIYASHQFGDVPNSHTFHNAIDWMADNGITAGCNPPANNRYCPDDPLTRGQMAAFMKRFHDTFIAGGAGAGVGLGVTSRGGTTPPDSGNGVVQDLSMNLQIPTSGVLVVTANVQMANLDEPDALACGINFGSAPDTAQGDSWRVVDLTVSAFANCDTVTAVVASPGTQPVRVVVVEALATTQALEGNLSAFLYTQDGAFGLLGTTDDATEHPTLSDTPKGQPEV